MININLDEYLLDIDALRNLVRYQTAPRVSKESVAEHSFFVTSYVLKLHDYYDFDLAKALKMAILHDFSEVFISDVPHPIKKRFPKFEKELNEAEYQINKEYIGEDFANDLNEFNECTSIEGIMVALADVLSVVSYAKYEMELGNSKYMRNVYNRSKDRYRGLIQQADKYLRNNFTSFDIIKYVESFMDAKYNT